MPGYEIILLEKKWENDMAWNDNKAPFYTVKTARKVYPKTKMQNAFHLIYLFNCQLQNYQSTIRKECFKAGFCVF